MQDKIIWQQSSTKPENPNNLALISQWWRSLANQKITLAQRMIPQSGEVDELNWDIQRFDEVFELKNPDLRGITLYWRKTDSEQERKTTPHQLVLDLSENSQKLAIADFERWVSSSDSQTRST